MKGYIRELSTQSCVIDRVADAVEPLVHLDIVFTHALADDVHRDLQVAELAAGDTREDGDNLFAREFVAPEVEALACEAARVLEEANGDGPYVRDRDLRQLPRRRERRGVDAFRRLGPVRTKPLALSATWQFTSQSVFGSPSATEPWWWPRCMLTAATRLCVTGEETVMDECRSRLH